MTAALANEITTLQSLLRGLCLSKTCVSVVNRGTTRLSKSVYQPRAQAVRSVSTSPLQVESTTNALRTNVSFSGILCGCRTTAHTWMLIPTSSFSQQHRSYAKKAGPQRKPLSFEYSGDLTTQSPLNPAELHKDYKELTELQEASDVVQKLCSIDFATGLDKRRHRKEEMRKRILKLFGPGAEREMHVAMLTVEIRNLIPHVITVRKDKKSKSVLVEKIQMRKKILKFLRREDYQRFLWLLRELRIRYVLPPDYYKHESKRFKRKQEVFKAADELRKKKIAELREQLESEREEFMQYKAETLKQIEDDMAKYNLDKEQFAAKLRRKREGKTYPHIYTWEERQQMAQELAMK